MRSGLPDGLLVSLLLQHLSMMRVARWGYPTVYDGYMVRYIVEF